MLSPRDLAEKPFPLLRFVISQDCRIGVPFASRAWLKTPRVTTTRSAASLPSQLRLAGTVIVN